MDENYLVTKSNYFIMNSSYDLSLEEQKIILTLASMVQPTDEEFKPYKFRINDFMELLGVDTKTKYTEIPKITKELMKKVFEIHEGDTLIQTAWLSSATYKKGSGIVELEFSPKLKPYMLHLKEKFTQYKLANILSMKSKYSPRMYEFLKCNEFKNQNYMEIEVDELRKLLKVENIYTLYADFKRKIILKTQKELKKISDISFEFEELKTGRKVTAIKFHIKSKNKQNTKSIAEAPKQTKKENEELIQNISFVLKSWELTHQEVKKILEVANWDIEVINDKYQLVSDYAAKNTVENYFKIMIKAIKEDWKPSNNQGSKDSFNDYEQREYDYAELEKKLLGLK